jgi:thiamine biosynthesis protein ThiS
MGGVGRRPVARSAVQASRIQEGINSIDRHVPIHYVNVNAGGVSTESGVAPRPLVPDPGNAGVGKRKHSDVPGRFRGFLRFRRDNMRITLNGEAIDIAEGSTIAGLLEHLQLQRERVAVEVNLDIVPKTAYDGHGLSDGDRIEIVHFVGGG